MRRSVKSKLRGGKKSSFFGYAHILMANPLMLYGSIASVLLILSLAHVQMSNDSRTQMWSFFSPIFSTISKPFIAVSSFAGNITSYQQLQADNKLLKVENERLNEWYHMAQLLKAENQSLKSLLNVQSLSDHSFITAQIMTDPSSPYVQSVLLDVGTDDGVTVGQAVIAKNGILGRIVDVQDTISRVLLVTDISSRIPVVLKGTSQRAVLAGRNLERPILDYIPETVTLDVGMTVLTSGDGGVLPVGLPVGTIDSIVGDRITVVPLARHDISHYVRVLKKRE